MKSVFRKRLSLALALPLLAAAVWLPGGGQAHAQDAPSATKATRAKSRSVMGALTQAGATSLTVSTAEGTQEITLTNKTDIARLETGLAISDLKVGDTLALMLPGTNGHPTVQSLAPLTLQFDNASLTFNNTDKAKFTRYTKLSPTDLAAGQNVKIAVAHRANGTVIARTVQVTGEAKGEKAEEDKEE